MKNRSIHRRRLFYEIAIFPVNRWLYSNKKLAGHGLAKFVASAVGWAAFCCGQWIPLPPPFEYSWRFDTLQSLGKLVVPVTEQYTIHGKTRAVFVSTTVIACYPVLPDCINVWAIKWPFLPFFQLCGSSDLLRGDTFPVPLYSPK